MDEQRFHVFLSHSSRDDAAAVSIAQWLRLQGVKVWIDKWSLIPGTTWQEEIEKALQKCDSFAILIGAERTKWQNEEMRVAIERRVAGSGTFRVIPVLLPAADPEALPPQLARHSYLKLTSATDPDGLYRLKCGIYGVQPDAVPYEGAPPPTIEKRAPYKGLHSFDVGDADLFFGREELSAAIESRILDISARRGQLRLLTIYGRSGSGKSSVAKAGVLGNLAKNSNEDGGWAFLHVLPGSDPLRSLANAVSTAFGAQQTLSSLDEMVQRFKDNHATLENALDILLRAQGSNRRALVLVDQFEECFTSSTDERARRDFIENLTHAAKADSGNAVVMITVRVEELGTCLEYPDLAKSLSDLAFPVLPIASEEDLRRAIENPARAANAAVEPALTELLLKDVKDEPGVLPLLQYTLEQLWIHRTSDTLTVKLYQSLGQVGGLLRDQAEKTLTYLTKKELPVCRHIFVSLVQEVDGGFRYVRHRLKLQSMVTKRFPLSVLLPVVRALAAENARLLTIHKGPVTGGRVVEIAHEELIRSWPQLKTWLRKDRTFRRWCGRLEGSRLQWEHAKRDKRALLDGRLLAEAERWVKRRSARLNDSQTEYIRLSAAHRRMQRLTRGAIAAGVLIAIGAGVFTVQLYSRDSESRELARRATEEIRNFADRPIPASVALHALQEAPTREAQEALHLAVQFGATFIEGHLGGVDALAYSRDGEHLLTAGSDGGLSVWEVESANRVKPGMCHTGSETESGECRAGQALAVSFGSDRSSIVSASADGTVRVWRDHKQVGVLDGGPALTKVVYHEDSQRIFGTSAKGLLLQWSTADLKAAPKKLLQASSLTALAAAPDWKRLAVGTADGAVKLLDLTPPGQASEFEQVCDPAGRINDLRFSGDGKLLAVACQSGNAVVWDIRSSSASVKLPGQNDAVFGIALSPDSDKVVTMTRTAGAFVWDRATGSNVLTLMTPDRDDSQFRAIAFGPVRCAGYVQPLAVACANGRVRIYDLDLQSLVRRAESIAIRRTFKSEECQRIFNTSTCAAVPVRRFGLLGK